MDSRFGCGRGPASLLLEYNITGTIDTCYFICMVQKVNWNNGVL